jgi:MarR family transcriptional regulator, organic hydroperoxide resistance regulator
VLRFENVEPVGYTGPVPAVKQPSRSAATEAWSLIWSLFDRRRPIMMAMYREHGLTPPQLITLRRLDTETPVPMSEVAKSLACDPSNVTGIIDRLEERGLVERRDAPKDRRVRMLALTPAGARLRDGLGERMSVPPTELERLPAADQRALRDILRRAVESGESG